MVEINIQKSTLTIYISLSCLIELVIVDTVSDQRILASNVPIILKSLQSQTYFIIFKSTSAQKSSQAFFDSYYNTAPAFDTKKPVYCVNSSCLCILLPPPLKINQEKEKLRWPKGVLGPQRENIEKPNVNGCSIQRDIGTRDI